MPKRRAASRWLSPSTWQAWRTRPYSSTENIPAFPGSFRTSLRTAMPRYAFVPPRPDYPTASVAYFSSAALMPFLTNDPLPQCLQQSSAMGASTLGGHERDVSAISLKLSVSEQEANARLIDARAELNKAVADLAPSIVEVIHSLPPHIKGLVDDLLNGKLWSILGLPPDSREEDASATSDDVGDSTATLRKRKQKPEQDE